MDDVQKLKDNAGALAEIVMIHYTAYRNVGFTESQAFELARYVHATIYS